MASYGLLLRGDGKGDFQAVKNSGFKVPGEVRDLLILKKGKESLVLSSMNNDKMRLFKY